MMLRASLVLWLLVLFSSAAAKPAAPDASCHFRFMHDTLAYPNELVWEYHVDPTSGKTTISKRKPAPQYALHCFAMVRTTRLFFDHARFEPNEPKATHPVYRYLIRRVLAFEPSTPPKCDERIVIPGYADLYEFSRDYGDLLKEECGGAWHSYMQRGNWRVPFPFWRAQQEQTANQLVSEIHHGRFPIVHLVRFPKLNHAVLLYSCSDAGGNLVFQAYDPNEPARGTELVFDRAQRSFVLGSNRYFAGGKVNAYEIYRGLMY